MTTPQYYVHDIDPVAIHLWGNVGIHWYGVAYVMGFAVVIYMLHLFYKRGKSPLGPEQQATAVTALILGVMIGGRLGHVLLYDLAETLRDPISIFKVWHGGMASHGGFAGIIVAAWWVSRRFKIPYLSFGDLLAVMAPPGFMLGRIANFVNGELWGKPTDVPWAVIFPQSAYPGTPLNLIPPRHPSQLYEAVLEGLLLMIFTQLRFWKTGVLKHPGRLAGEFFLAYAVVRIIGEQFREPDAALILGMNPGAFYSIFIGIVGGFLIVRSYFRPAVTSPN
jgi:phosphatidylglycerol:prolipoprotein diacylglycerol transferase